MGEKLLEWVEKIATGEKRRWFFAALITIAILVIIVFPYIDANFLYYNRIEKRIDNLSDLVSLTNTPLEENEILYEEYLSILEEIKTARENALFGSEKSEDTKSDRIIKFAGGAILWFFVAVALLFSKNQAGQPAFKQFINKFFSAILCFIIGAILGYGSIYIPTIVSAKINFVLTPIIQIIVMWLIIESPKPKSKES